MKRFLSCALVWCTGAFAQDVPGQFDYYVLSLSWSPNWCRLEGDARGADQCREGRDWVVHGLWPQYGAGGYPSDCNSGMRAPSRQETAAQVDVFGSAGSAWHQWRKHGSCTGLPADDYYKLTREALGRLALPEVLSNLDRAVTLPAGLIEEAFLAENPDLEPDGVTITCRDGGVQEVRICLSRDLQPRRCGRDVVRDCTLPSAWFEPAK